jgi:hypothetical protein
MRITLPINYTRKLGLRPGDFADLYQEDGIVKLKFVRVKTPAELEAVKLGEPAE